MTLTAPLGNTGGKVATAQIGGVVRIFSGDTVIMLLRDEAKDLFYLLAEKFETEKERDDA